MAPPSLPSSPRHERPSRYVEVCHDEEGLRVQTQADARNVVTVFDTCNSPVYVVCGCMGLCKHE